ncbi:MAG: sulfotransferase family 2 domain-containing protein [Alphaproteobacteria bacterium]
MDRFVAYRNPHPDDVPLFFYHVPKTAGTTVTGVLHALASARGRGAQHIPRTVGMREKPLPAALKKFGSTLAFMGHCWFGFHEELPGLTRPCVVLRDPVERVVSDYLWQCRVHQREPSARAEDFLDFLDNVVLSNAMTRQIRGGAEIGWNADTFAIRRLESCFLVGTTAGVGLFLSALLTAYGGPTVLARRSKEERSPVKAELVARFADVVRQRNAYDCAVFAHAEQALAPRAQALLAGFTEPNDETMSVENIRGKTYRVERVAPVSGAPASEVAASG